MFCGSCMHDNALAKSLSDVGLDVQLVPTYTPIRTDEADVSVDQVFFGGINVYLQQKIPLMRWLPTFVDRFLDNPALIRRVTSRSMDMAPKELGRLAVSMLKGTDGNQRKEVKRLCRWLKEHAKPDAVVFSNALIGGCIPEIKRQLGVPILVTLQGDDVFLDSLPDNYRQQCIDAIKRLVADVDGFVVHSEFFRDYMSEYFSIPVSKVHVTPLGIDTSEFPAVERQPESDGLTLGYLARIAPEKGLHQLVDAFVQLKQADTMGGKLKLKVAGWLGPQDEAYANENFDKIRVAGFESNFEYLGAIERVEKLQFLSSIDVMSVPTTFLEPKGLYALEAMACGVPVVQPNHGCFPELLELTGGGLLFDAANHADYVKTLSRLLNDSELRGELGGAGRAAVVQNRNAEAMGMATADVIRKFAR